MRPRSGIIGLLLISLAIRLAWALIQPSSNEAIDRLPDQREYLTLAQNLLHGNGFGFHDARFDADVYAYRTPGYPMFMAMVGASPRAVRLAQAFLDTSTVLAVWLLATRVLAPSFGLRRAQSSRTPGEGWGEGDFELQEAFDKQNHPHPNPLPAYTFDKLSAGREMGPRKMPLLAAACIAFNPFLIYFSGLLLSETLLIAMLTWGAFLLTKPRGFSPLVFRPTLQTTLGLILLAASILVRPSGLLLPAILAALVPTQLKPAQRFARAVAALAITFLILLPWAYRNHRLLGPWIWTTTNGGVTLYDGFNPAAQGDSDQRFLANMPELRAMGEVERSNHLAKLAKQWAADHPGQSMKLALIKLARTWSPMPLSEDFGKPAYRAIALAYSLPFDAIIVMGLLRKNITPAIKLYLLAPAIYFSIVHALSVGSLRYRIPAEPTLAVVVAGAWKKLRKSECRMQNEEG